MRWYWFAFLLLASLLPVSAEDWTTADGKVYHNVTVVGQEDDGVRITYDGGVGKVPYYELPVDIQKRFGQDLDSLAAKKQAVDQAVQDAVNSAANSQIVEPIVTIPQAPAMPSPANTAPTPGAMPSGGSTPEASAPNATPGNAPANAAGPAGGGTTAAAKPGSAAPGPGVAPGTAPGAPKAATNGPHPPGSPAGGAVELPSLSEPVSRTPQPSGLTAAGGKPLQLSVANYSYNTSLDVCYLDCPAIDVSPVPAPVTPPPSGQGSSLTLRMVTDGRTPQAPDRLELTFLCVGGDGGDLSTRPITFNADSGPLAVDDANRKDSGTLPSGGQSVQYTSFYLPVAQVRLICNGKPLTFTVGPNKYRIDERGALILHDYIADVDTLEPATPSFIHTFYKLLARIPSIFTIISTICEYVILGSFGLLVAASIAAFILGVTRFIKM